MVHCKQAAPFGQFFSSPNRVYVTFHSCTEWVQIFWGGKSPQLQTNIFRLSGICVKLHLFICIFERERHRCNLLKGSFKGTISVVHSFPGEDELDQLILFCLPLHKNWVLKLVRLVAAALGVTALSGCVALETHSCVHLDLYRRSWLEPTFTCWPGVVRSHKAV